MLKKIIFVGVAISICLPQVQAKNYYKWVDSKGRVTYSSKPPPAGAKQQQIETLRSLGTTPTAKPTRQEFKSNASIPTQYINPYQNSNRTVYATPRQPVRSAEDEALRQKIIKEASTPYKGAMGLTASQRKTLVAVAGDDENLRQKIIKEASTPIKGARDLTSSQRRTLAAMAGVDVSADDSNSRNSYSAPAPQRVPSTITSCDGAGCWGSDGTRYNHGAGDTYFPSTGGTCQSIGGQMQCN